MELYEGKRVLLFFARKNRRGEMQNKEFKKNSPYEKKSILWPVAYTEHSIPAATQQ